MRKDQVSIRIERFGDEVPKNYPEKTQRIQVYADANNLYEALVSACSAIIEEVRKYESVPSFGRVDASSNATEQGKFLWNVMHSEKSEDKNK